MPTQEKQNMLREKREVNFRSRFSLSGHHSSRDSDPAAAAYTRDSRTPRGPRGVQKHGQKLRYGVQRHALYGGRGAAKK